MSGISGFCNYDINFREDSGKWFAHLQKMAQSRICQKTCKNQFFLSPHAGLSQSSLSKLASENTKELPLRITFHEKTAVLIFHGELYNQEELLQNLLSNQISPSSITDPEIVLLGYLYEGIDFIRRINGSFSFCIYDETSQTLFLARDRLGVKPLFYTFCDNTLLFSSELMELFSFSENKPVLDQEGFMEIFGLGPAKRPASGIFQNVFELPPGGLISYKNNTCNLSYYWKLESHPHPDHPKDTVEHVRFLIEDSVKHQLFSHGKMCSFLSGGVDSSLVTSLGNQAFRDKGESLDTFSFDFTDNKIHFQANAFQPSLDRPFVEEMVQFLDTDHHFLECNRFDLYQYLYKAVDARGLPCMADIESSLLYFCEQVSATHQTALTGECADEIFGGYPWFHKEEMINATFFPWSMDFGPRTMLLKDEINEMLPMEDFAHTAYADALKEVPYLPGESETERKRREISFLTIRFFMQTLLDRCDRAGNYTGLTARVPFADYRLVEYLWNVPWEIKNYNNTVKGLLREASKGLLPDSVLYRKKSPYPKTYDPNYENLLKNQLLEVLHSTDAPIREYVDLKKVTDYFSKPTNVTRPFYGQLMAGPQLIAYLLQINYWLSHYHIEVLL